MRLQCKSFIKGGILSRTSVLECLKLVTLFGISITLSVMMIRTQNQKHLWIDTVEVLLFCDGRLKCSAALAGDSGPLLCFLSQSSAAPWKDCLLWPAKTWSPAGGQKGQKCCALNGTNGVLGSEQERQSQNLASKLFPFFFLLSFQDKISISIFMCL